VGVRWSVGTDQVGGQDVPTLQPRPPRAQTLSLLPFPGPELAQSLTGFSPIRTDSRPGGGVGGDGAAAGPPEIGRDLPRSQGQIPIFSLSHTPSLALGSAGRSPCKMEGLADLRCRNRRRVPAAENISGGHGF
jgi:hypothetical protein